MFPAAGINTTMDGHTTQAESLSGSHMQPAQTWKAPTKAPGQKRAACFPRVKANCSQLAEGTPGPWPLPSAKAAEFQAKIKGAQGKDKQESEGQSVHLLRTSRLLCGVIQPFRHHDTAPSLGSPPDLFYVQL